MAGRTRSFSDGEMIFREGDPGGSAFTILKGKVSLVKDTTGAPVETGVLGKSASFGEVGVMNGGLRTLTAVAVGAVKVAVRQQEVSAPGKKSGKKPGKKTGKKTGNATGKKKDSSPRKKASKDVLPPVPRLLAIGMDGGTGGGGNWLSRLLMLGAGESRFIEVRIVPFHGEPDQREPGQREPDQGKQSEQGRIFARSVADALAGCDGIRARLVAWDGPFAQNSPARATTMAQATTMACVAEARKVLQRTGGDLLIWGTMTPSGDRVNLHLVSALADDEGRPGSYNGFCDLPVPVDLSRDLSQQWTAVLNAVVLSATVTETPAKTRVALDNLEAAIEDAMAIARKPPRDLPPQERASLLIAIGNAVATVCQRQREQREPERITSGLDIYRRALDLITAEDHAPIWGYAWKQVGNLLFLQAERTGGEQSLQDAVTACKAAIDAISHVHLPFEWAAAQNKLGLALYRLNLRDVRSDTKMLKSAIAAFCAAVQVYTRADVPNRWADVMNNYAQAAQVLGERLHEPQILLKAVSACRNALEVRNRNETPYLWAATHNTMGSALFLLGKLTDRHDYLDAATDAFTAAYQVYIKTGANRSAAVIGRNLDRVEDLRNAFFADAHREDHRTDMRANMRTDDADSDMRTDDADSDMRADMRNDVDWWRKNVVDDPSPVQQVVQQPGATPAQQQRYLI